MNEFLLCLPFCFVAAVIGYNIGRKAGYEAGREHELDKAAQRHIRMSRFSNMQHKKNPCSPPIGSPYG